MEDINLFFSQVQETLNSNLIIWYCIAAFFGTCLASCIGLIVARTPRLIYWQYEQEVNGFLEERGKEMLKNNIISGAVCDVFESEPLPEDSPLWKLENLIITPHICGNSDTYIAKALRVFSDNFQNYIINKKMFNIIV